MYAAMFQGVSMPKATESARKLSSVLEEAIKQNKWSTREAARKWGMGQSTLQKLIATPGRIPRKEQMEKIAAGLNMPLEQLLQLCGYEEPVERRTESEALIARAIEGFTSEGLMVLSRLTPRQKAAMIAYARSTLPPDE